MDEYAAIELMRNGDIRGLEALVRIHQVRAMRTAFLVTRDAPLAQDVVQSAFLRAFERIHQLDPARPFSAWFLTSVVHAAIKAVGRRDRHASIEDLPSTDGLPVDGDPGPESIWERTETAEEVWAALGELSPAHRAAVIARYYLGLTQEEMSQVLGCPESTVKWRLHAARARLRLLLISLISHD